MKNLIVIAATLFSTNLYAQTFECQDMNYSENTTMISIPDGSQRYTQEIPTSRANTSLEFIYVVDGSARAIFIKRTLAYDGSIISGTSFDGGQASAGLILNDGLSDVYCKKVQ